VIKVAIIDDQQLFRESLADALLCDPTIACGLQSANGDAFLQALQQPGAFRPDIVLLDLEMPVMNGIELNGILQKIYSSVKVIILSVHANEKLIASLIKAGVSGYLTKNCGKEEVLRAIHMVHDHGYYLNSNTMQAIQRQNDARIGTLYNVNNIPISLSKREVAVLQLICTEYGTAEIASELFISPRTVEGHRASMIQKIGCRNTAGLILFAIRHSIFVPSF